MTHSYPEDTTNGTVTKTYDFDAMLDDGQIKHPDVLYVSRSPAAKQLPANTTYERLNQKLQSASANERPALLLKLAQLYQNSADRLELESFNIMDRAWEARDANNLKAADALDAQAKEAERLSRDLRASGDALRQQLIDEAPQAPEADDAVFGLGFNAILRKDLEKAHTMYTLLLHAYPDSPYIPNALIELAEIEYNDAHLDTALQLYTQFVTDHPQDPAVPYALYKTTWVHINNNQWAKAFATHESLLKNLALSAQPNHDDLKRQILNDLVFIYGSWPQADPKKARATFASLTQDPEVRERLLTRLAQRYEEEGRPEDAASVRTPAP